MIAPQLLCYVLLVADASARRLLSLSEASQVFNDEIQRSREDTSRRHVASGSRVMNHTSEPSQDPLEKLVTTSRPSVSAFLCMQLDIDFSYLLPGLWANIGVLGGIRIDPKSGCWSANFDFSVGFEWGVKALGYYIGLSFMGSGTLDISEVPLSKTTRGARADQVQQIYLPEAADPNRCHTGNPFTLVQTYVEHQYWRMFQSSEAKPSARDIEQVRAKEAKLTATYRKLLDSAFETYEVNEDLSRTIKVPLAEDWLLDVEEGGGEPPIKSRAKYTAVNAPALVSPAMSMFAMARYFVGTLPAYATQVIERLVDNSHNRFGSDNERKNSNSYKRLLRSNGRLLARWPDEESLDVLEVVNISGVSKHGDGADQRVINFAKVARLSENTHDPLFWKEFAMSAGNLLVRTLADVHALFAAYFANDPTWDGNCESLASSFSVSPNLLFNESFQKRFESYPWASRSTRDKRRVAFTGMDEILESNGPKVARGLLGISIEKDIELLPHLWCVLGEDAPSSFEQEENESELLEFRRASQPFELSLIQSCQTVVHETRDLLLDDVIVWSEQHQRYDVFKSVSNDFAGFLYSSSGDYYGIVCKTCLHSLSEDGRKREAMEKQYVVANRKMEARLECENARLSLAFTRLFPRFAYIAKQFLLRMETVLLGINVCLEQVHNRDFLAESFRHLKSYSGIAKHCKPDTPRGEKLQYISTLGKHAVSLVRMLLIRLGARTSLESQSQVDDRIPLSKEEKALAIRGEVFFAPTAYYMIADFFEALGLGPSHRPKEPIHRTLDVETSARYELQGHLWPHFVQATARLFKAIDPTNCGRTRFEKRLRPALEFTQSLTFSAQLARTDFCTEGGMPNAGLLVLRATRKVTRRTWSTTEISPQLCLSARIRPGDFYVQVTQCYGSEVGGDGNQRHFSDWSVKVGSFALKLFSGLPVGGVLGNIMNSGTGPLQASVLSAATLGGDALSLLLAKRIRPYVQDSKILKGLLTMGVMSSPLLSVLGVTGTVTSESGFLGIVRRFLEHLSHHGDVIATESWPTPAPPFYSFDSGVSSILALVAEVSQKQWDDGSYEKHDSLHVESWNRVVFVGLALPSAARVQVYGRLDVDWDLSSWLQTKPGLAQNTSVPSI